MTIDHAETKTISRAGKRCRRLLLRIGCIVAATAAPALAATLEVGPGKQFAAPSAAIKAAHDGDTVLIAPGTYYDCAGVPQSHLTIAGASADQPAVLTDTTCGGKALLITGGRDITVRNLVLTRARVGDANGAGIRAEGPDLTVDHVQFINNQVGILGNAVAGSTIVVRDSVFAQNGRCSPVCGHGITVGGIRLLRVTGTVFREPEGGDFLRIAVQEAELVGNRFEDDATATTSPMVFVNGGSLTLQGNTVTLGPAAADRPGAVLVVGDASALAVRGNTLHEPAGLGVPLVRNWTGQTVVEADNAVPPDSVAVSDAGSTYHRARSQLAAWRGDLKDAYNATRHLAAVTVRAVIAALPHH
jgi:hypothetical protein